MAAAPRFTGTTCKLATFFGKVGAEGLVVALLDLYAQLTDQTTAKRSSGSGHDKYTMATGLLLPRQLSVSQGQPAKVTWEAIGVNAAGTTNPVIRATAAMPAITGVTELFTLGPIKINGTSYEGIQDLTVDFGCTERVHVGSGAVYPQLVYLETIAPRVTIKTEDSGLIAVLTTEGVAQGTTDSLLYLRKMDKNGKRVGDATPEHICIAVDDGIWKPNEVSGSHPGAVTGSFECRPTYDGSNLPLYLQAALAIT
jgi:hypothetical protein